MREITPKTVSFFFFFSNLKKHLLPNTGSDLNFIPFVQFFNIWLKRGHVNLATREKLCQVIRILKETFCHVTTLSKCHLACVAGAWKKWAKERTGAREGDKRFSGAFRASAPSPLACLLLARPFFLVPTTSKPLLRRLSAIHQDAKRANAYGTQIVSFEFAFRFNQDWSCNSNLLL